MSDEDIKKKQRKHWKRFKDVMSYLRPWRSSIKRIEGTSPPPPAPSKCTSPRVIESYFAFVNMSRVTSWKCDQTIT